MAHPSSQNECQAYYNYPLMLAQVSAKDHIRFQMSYATVLKAHMDALKKKEKKETRKSAAKAVGA